MENQIIAGGDSRLYRVITITAVNAAVFLFHAAVTQLEE